MTSLKAFWDKLQIGTKVKVTYNRYSKNEHEVRYGIIAIKQTNSVARTKGFDGSTERGSLVWMSKPTSKNGEKWAIKNNILVSESPYSNIDYEILS